MDHNTLTTIIESIASLILEGIVLGVIFQMISNKSLETQRKELQTEMYRIETQNRHNTELIMEELKEVKNETIAEIKERTL